MAIDFNKQLVFDPKIEIVGKEVPLAAMEKTGAVLQDRYDKAYEQYSLADEALKQMEASANPVDREKAKELRGLYNQEMQGILQKGDFHNMRHQVSALARNAAANYKTIAERNQVIQQNIDAIRKDPRYRLDPEGAVQHYLRDLKSISVNPETRTVSDFNVGTYGEAADFETADKLLQIAPTLRAKLLKGKGSYFGTRTLPTGEKVNTIETQGGGYRILDNKEIENELKSYIVTDPAFQAYITRDVKRMGLNPNSEEGKAAYNQLVQERTADTSKALGKMYEIDENMNQNTFSVIGGSGDGSGSGSKPKRIGVPVNTVADSYGVTNTSLRQNLVGALEGERGNYNYMINFLNQKINDKNLRPTEKLEYSNIKKALKDLDKLEPNEKEAIKNFFSLNTRSLDDQEAFKNLMLTLKPKSFDVANTLSKYIGTALSFDNPFEKEFTNYAKENQAFQNVNLVVPPYQDATTINNIDTWMKKSLSNNDFKPFKGKIDPKADYTLSKVSDRPIGNGTGVVLELKNTKDNSTILVEPKDARMLLPLNETFPGIVTANQFKNTSDFNNGESRSVLEIFNENKENITMPKNYPDYLKNGKITYNNGMFYLTDKNGNVLGDENGNPIMSTSYIDIIDL